MNTDLKVFLRQYANFSEAELKYIVSKFKNRLIKKNNCLLNQGDACKDLVFVRKGCLRLYYLREDIEVSVGLLFRNLLQLRFTAL